MEEIKEGEIVYANFKVRDTENKEHELRKVVFSREWKSDYPILKKEIYFRFLKQNSIKTDCTILDVKILARTGFKNLSTEYTNVKKNDQIRSKQLGQPIDGKLLESPKQGRGLKKTIFFLEARKSFF